MERKQFFSLLGLGATTFIAGGILQACSKSDTADTTPSTPTSTTVDFTLDLNDSAFSSLKNNGGYAYKNGIIIAKTTDGSYVAFSSACTHEGATITSTGGTGFICPRHGATFNNAGAATGGPAKNSLKKYNTQLVSSTQLRIFA